MQELQEQVFSAELTAAELSRLVGPLDENLRQIENAFGVQVLRRGHNFRFAGVQAAGAAQVLRRAAARIQAGEDLTVNDVQMMIIAEQRGGETEDDEGFTLRTRRSGLRPRTPNQKAYLKALLESDVTFGIGPAGTGKTYLAVAAAVDAFERDAVERIVLTRPAIEAGERLGFLPGDLTQKVDPYLRPLYDALFDLFGFEKTQRLIEKQVIEIAPLAYMRGRTLNNAFVILDEAQNTTVEQMKMFLTRIGFGTRAVITGDVTQVDLPRGVRSGLAHASRVLENVRGIAMVHQELQPIPARTVAENIWLGRYPTKKYGIITVVDHAKMYKDTDELLKKLKLDIDPHAKLGSLSIAQMQMVEIAKAVSANCKVLILDDSTSAVDTATDAKIRAALKEALPGATKLIIAQRVTSVMDADMILVPDDGHIVGQGTHAQLMERCDIYREVYESQQEGVSIDG